MKKLNVGQSMGFVQVLVFFATIAADVVTLLSHAPNLLVFVFIVLLVHWLVTPGILVGVAGYIVGTPLGLLIYSWW